jgi:hypothetical protein
MLPKDCMGIMTKMDGELQLEMVEQKITNQLTKFNWKY